MQDFINAKAPTLATTYNASIGSNVEITLNTGTSYIEVTAIGAGVFLKYGSTASPTTFDEFVGVGLTRTYVIPTGTTKVDFVQESATGKIVIIQK